VLFLVVRIPLARQTDDAFAEHLGAAAPPPSTAH
jgi:hypothetical protein